MAWGVTFGPQMLQICKFCPWMSYDIPAIHKSRRIPRLLFFWDNSQTRSQLWFQKTVGRLHGSWLTGIFSLLFQSVPRTFRFRLLLLIPDSPCCSFFASPWPSKQPDARSTSPSNLLAYHAGNQSLPFPLCCHAAQNCSRLSSLP